MEKRNVYDLSHFAMQCGQIGSLQGISTIPVVAGDSMELDLEGVFRLSPLRRNLYIDVQVDLFAFYVPYRQLYSNWTDFIKQGTDESVTLGTHTVHATQPNFCCGTKLAQGATVPSWIMDGYTKIWNRYFKDPTDDTGDIDETEFTGGNANKNLYGVPCCHQPRLWNSGIYTETDSTDREVSAAGSVVDLTDFAKQQGRYKSELKREWFAQRYSDVMQEIFGTYASTDQDERPTLLAHTKSYLSGYDVDGTGDTNLGSYSGKATGLSGLKFPMKHFNEHGVIFIQALLRFPPVHYEYLHYLVKQSEPTYKQIAGDPDIIANEPPMAPMIVTGKLNNA